MEKIKERILKAARVVCKGIPIRLSAYFSTETLQVRKERQDIFKVMKGKNIQYRILYRARLSFRIGERKKCSNKKKLKEYSNTKSILKEILKALL